MQDLWLASAFFVVTHLGIPSRPLPEPLVRRLGERGYRAPFSLPAFVARFSMIASCRSAPHTAAPNVGAGLRHLPVGPVPFAFLLVARGLATPNPVAMGQRPDADAREPATGVEHVGRHPLPWGVALWAVPHMLANGHRAALPFFGSFTLLALAGTVPRDRRRLRQGGPGSGVRVPSTSNVPFRAILQRRQRLVLSEIGRSRVAPILDAPLLLFHGWLFGRPLL